MTAESDTNWLMQYRILRLVNQCRRLIQSEFGDKPHLTDNNLRESLALFAGQTRNQALQRVYAELRLALIDLEGPDELVTATEPAGQRRYRGQVIPDQAAPVVSPPPVEQEPARPKRTIIYRGQKREI